MICYEFQSNEGLNGNETDSACEEDILDDELLGEEPESIIPQQVLDLADHALARLPPRWRNWITRVISGLSLISGFSFLISLGPIGLFFLVSAPNISNRTLGFLLFSSFPFSSADRGPSIFSLSLSVHLSSIQLYLYL